MDETEIAPSGTVLPGIIIPEPPLIGDERLRALYRYWLELAGKQGGLPCLTAFDPLCVPRILANVWVLEIDAGTGRFRMRLAGEEINAIYGHSIAGRFFEDIFASDMSVIMARYRRALREPSIFLVRGNVYAVGNRVLTGERLGLPMIGRSSLTDTLLGGTIYSGILNRDDPIPTLSGNVAYFHPVEAVNHRPHTAAMEP